jgi:hypothetical protein
MRRQVVERVTNVIAFSTSFIVFTSALSNAPEIYPKDDEPGVVQRSSGTKDDFVVHRAAAEWMRM